MVMTALERRVYQLWQALPYHGFTACLGCGEHLNCCGTSPDTRVCLTCFEFTYNERAPRRRSA